MPGNMHKNQTASHLPASFFSLYLTSTTVDLEARLIRQPGSRVAV